MPVLKHRRHALVKQLKDLVKTEGSGICGHLSQAAQPLLDSTTLWHVFCAVRALLCLVFWQ